VIFHSYVKLPEGRDFTPSTPVENRDFHEADHRKREKLTWLTIRKQRLWSSRRGK